MRRRGFFLGIASLLAAAGCADEPRQASVTGSGGGAVAGTTTSMGGAGPGGGGSDPCGGCDAPTPFCDEAAMQCVACLDHGDCTEPGAAKCDAGSCVACDASPQCAGIAGAEVCDTEAGSCVECDLGEEDACDGGAGQTCDLLGKNCVDIAPGDVQNCGACKNDLQCATGHRCIPMDFEGSAHGHYCLREPNPGCTQPFGVAINKPSISGAVTQDYCGIEEDLTTCEAVLSLAQGWHCTGVDGMCSELMGGAEVAVPGAICRQVGLLPDRCTYACGSTAECLSTGPGSSCGGDPIPMTPPGWCGG